MITNLKPYPADTHSSMPVPRTRQAGAWYDPASVKIGCEISTSTGTSTSQRPCGRWKKSARIFWQCRRKRKGCWRRFWEEHTMNEELKFARFILVLSSIAPLFILWAIQGNSLIPDDLFTGLCMMMVIIPNAFLWLRIQTAKKLGEKRELVTGRAEDHRDHLLV